VTTPMYEVEVECPRCGLDYTAWRRDSINLMLSPMTEAEIEAQLSTTCPSCGYRDFGVGLVVDRELDR